MEDPTIGGESKKNDESLVLLGTCDITCGRKSESSNHVGNGRFRITISLHLAQYNAATDTVRQRNEVTTSIISILRNRAGARFLKKKKDGTYYVELNEIEMSQKVAHAHGDMNI